MEIVACHSMYLEKYDFKKIVNSKKYVFLDLWISKKYSV